MKIVLATRNRGKFQEIASMIQVDGVEFVPIMDFDIEDPEETGETYRENAILKARFAAKHTGFPALADDSGMEIQALGGYPGIRSARCAGKNASEHNKLEHILEKMQGVKDRRVDFVCCLAIAYPAGQGLTAVFEGRCSGLLAEEIQGEVESGVQYDAIFVLPEYDRTFGELSKEIKNDISHRAEACRKMRSYLNLVKQWKKTNIMLDESTNNES